MKSLAAKEQWTISYLVIQMSAIMKQYVEEVVQEKASQGLQPSAIWPIQELLMYNTCKDIIRLFLLNLRKGSIREEKENTQEEMER